MGDVNIFFDTYKFVNCPSIISKGKPGELLNNVFSRPRKGLVDEWNNIPRQEIQRDTDWLSETKMHCTCECKWKPYEILIM